MKVRISITGTAPLLMHNARLANPLDPIVRELKTITSKRTKTDDDYARMARLEHAGGLYMDDEIGPFLPGINVEASIVQGGRITKQGKQIERGLFVIDDVAPLIYAGPRNVDKLWEAGYYQMDSVKVGTNRVVRTRPVFRDWAVEVDAELDPALLSVESLAAIAADAGTMVGLGDHRPRYGRYMSKVEAI